MAKAPQKITLSPSRDIAFDKLVLSQSNVRKIKAGVSVEELAEDIARRGLLQSLHVRPVLNARGQESGKFEIPAGGRRYQALALLVKQKRLAKNTPIPCIVREADSEITAEDDSLAENLQRAALHPLDQFRAFVALREKGQSEEEIAAAFFVAPQVVRQRLKLAAVAPALLDVYAEDDMTLEQLMAFTVNPDHDRQCQVWEALKSSWSKDPYQIRRMLTETSVRAEDSRAAFVGAAAYEAAGGTILRDLFESDRGGWFEDVALLDKLVAEKLTACAEAVAEEGWKWIEVAVDLPYGFGMGLRKMAGTSRPMSDEENAALAKLREEFQALEAEYAQAEEYPDEVDERLGDLEDAIEALEQRPIDYDQEEIARAGAFVTIDRSGELSVHRGYVRVEDEPAAEGDIEEVAEEAQGVTADNRDASTVITSFGQAEETVSDEDREGVLKPLPERLMSELTAHRTLALRDAIGGDPDAALTLLLMKMVNDCFGSSTSAGSCLEASVRQVYLPAQAPDLAESVVAKSVDARHAGWTETLPLGDDAVLWSYLAGLDQERRLALLAHCLSFGVNTLHEKVNPYGAGITESGLSRRMAQADIAARATGLDMVEAGWEPTVENYLGRVPKARILEAVREAKGEGAAQLIDHLKKDEMAKEAERLLKGSGWLPDPLRLAEPDTGTGSDDMVGEVGVDDLPAFLADVASDEMPAVAAE